MRLEKHYVKQEGFVLPSQRQQSHGATHEAEAHGYEREFDVRFTPYITGQEAFDILRETHESHDYT